MNRMLMGSRKATFDEQVALQACRQAAARHAPRFRGLPVCDVEDLAQIALMKVWQRRKKFNPSLSDFSQWAFGTANSAILDYWDSESAHRRRVEVLGHGLRVVWSRDPASVPRDGVPALIRKIPAPRMRWDGLQGAWPWIVPAPADPAPAPQRRIVLYRRQRRSALSMMLASGQWIWLWGVNHAEKK